MNTPADIWKLVLGLLQGRLQAVTLDAWFDDLTAVEFKDDTLLLHTPDKFKKEIIDERYLQTIKDALRDLFSADINVIVTTGDAPTPIAHNNYPEDEYTFEQFIVGSSNKFAHAAATAVANNPAKNYNPLFIYAELHNQRMQQLQEEIRTRQEAMIMQQNLNAARLSEQINTAKNEIEMDNFIQSCFVQDRLDSIYREVRDQ